MRFMVLLLLASQVVARRTQQGHKLSVYMLMCELLCEQHIGSKNFKPIAGLLIAPQAAATMAVLTVDMLRKV